jgi:hypothetical protein
MWNRFFNINGGKGRNIPLDLKKEQQNRVLKNNVAWYRSKSRWAKCSQSCCFFGVCRTNLQYCRQGLWWRGAHTLNENIPSKKRQWTKSYQIFLKLMFSKTFQEEKAYDLFPQFKCCLLDGLDYRSLHIWIKENVELWGPIYEKRKCLFSM